MTQQPTPPAPQTPPPVSAPGPVPGPSPLSQDERTWGMLCHLAALAGYFTGGLGCIIGPLAVWLIKKDQYPFVNQQGKEALNWQITMLIGFVICIPLMFVLIGMFLLPALLIVDLVFTIVAAIKANEGIPYRYPWRIQFLK